MCYVYVYYYIFACIVVIMYAVKYCICVVVGGVYCMVIHHVCNRSSGVVAYVYMCIL